MHDFFFDDLVALLRVKSAIDSLASSLLPPELDQFAYAVSTDNLTQEIQARLNLLGDESRPSWHRRNALTVYESMYEQCSSMHSALVSKGAYTAQYPSVH